MARGRRQGGVTLRGKTYRIHFRDADGRRRFESANTGDKRVAIQLLTRRLREVADGTYKAGATPATTLRDFSKIYLDDREADGMKTVAQSEAKLRLYILPTLGEKRIDAITPAMVKAWVMKLRAESGLGPKTIRNAHTTLRACLQHAVFKQLLVVNAAAELPRGVLPKLRRRQGYAFSRAEVHALVYDERVREDLRVLNAILAFTGMRRGEAVGLSWSDLDLGSEDLARLLVTSQYDDETLKGPDGDGAHRVVPVHPELGRVLEAWRRVGFARTLGRLPRAEDPIVPNGNPESPHFGLRYTEQAHAYQFTEAVKLLGIKLPPKAKTHAFRRHLIRSLRDAGVRDNHIRALTHSGPTADVLDGYDVREWRDLCAAVRTLEIAPPVVAPVVELGAAVGAGFGASATDAPVMTASPEGVEPSLPP